MILYGYSFFNKKVGAYTDPQFQVYEKSLKVEMVQRAFMLSGDKEKEQYLESELYFVGTMDDKTGLITAIKPEFLCSFNGGLNDDGKSL